MEKILIPNLVNVRCQWRDVYLTMVLYLKLYIRLVGKAKNRKPARLTAFIEVNGILPQRKMNVTDSRTTQGLKKKQSNVDFLWKHHTLWSSANTFLAMNCTKIGITMFCHWRCIDLSIVIASVGKLLYNCICREKYHSKWITIQQLH